MGCLYAAAIAIATAITTIATAITIDAAITKLAKYSVVVCR